jgi:hypothetical protein
MKRLAPLTFPSEAFDFKGGLPMLDFPSEALDFKGGLPILDALPMRNPE